MIDSFFLDIDLIACPTIRDHDGLALSSRNTRLTRDQRQLAAKFPRFLSMLESDLVVAEQLEQSGFLVDYIETQGNRRFGAVKLGQVRLIDNLIISEETR